MTTYRLTRIEDVVRYWPFLSRGLLFVSRYLKYDLTLEVYRRILFRLVRQPSTAWIAVVLDDSEIEPLAFVLAYDCTPLFSSVREFEVSIFYHLPGFREAICTIQTSLDNFCRTNQISHYYVTTCRKSGSSTRVFGEEWNGLKRAYTVFKRKL